MQSRPMKITYQAKYTHILFIKAQFCTIEATVATIIIIMRTFHIISGKQTHKWKTNSEAVVGMQIGRTLICVFLSTIQYLVFFVHSLHDIVSREDKRDT